MPEGLPGDKSDPQISRMYYNTYMGGNTIKVFALIHTHVKEMRIDFLISFL